MNCVEIQRYCLENAENELPADIRQHVDSCVECRKAHAQARMVVQLVSLKRFEQPDPGFEARSLVLIRQAIEEQEAQPRGWWQKTLDLLGAETLPAFRYAMTMVVVGLIGMNMFSVQNLAPISSSTPIDPLHFRPAQPIRPLALASTNLSPSGHLSAELPIVFLPPSNSGIRAPQYGIGGTLPVSFEVNR